MTRPFPTRALQFYLTAPGPCPYLEGRRERKVFAHLDDDEGPVLNDALTLAGFRRSQRIIYRPACEGCDACVSARIPVRHFRQSRSQRRIYKRNADLVRVDRAPNATDEQYALLQRYLAARHSDGGMTSMSFPDYAMMAADTPARTTLAEYRLGAEDGPLMAAALVDRLADGFSLVYSYFDPDEPARSLGSHIILDHVERARGLDLHHVYLGYWVKGAAKMAYKAQFQPLEVLRRGGWRRLDPSEVEPS